MSTDELIKKIKEIEQGYKQWLDPNSIVRTTEETAALLTRKKIITENSVEIKRNLKLDLILWISFSLIFSSLFGFVIIKEILSTNRNLLGITIGISLVLLLAFGAHKNLTLKRLTLPIILSEKQITVVDETFQWQEIENTFIVSRPKKFVFVIGLKNGEIKYFDIGNQLGFRYNEQSFSVLVEHFKSKHFTENCVA